MSNEAFRKRIANYDEGQLTRLHRDVQRQAIRGGTSIAVGVTMAIPSGGISMVGAAIGGIKMYQASKKIKIIETRLRQEGWAGHDVTARDFIVPVAVGAAGLAAGGAVDMAFDSNEPQPATQDTEFSATDSNPADADMSTPSGGFDPSCPADGPGAPGSESLPTITWDVTDEGVQMLVDGQPIESTYGYLDPSGFYQVPIDPADPSTGSILMWDDPLAGLDPLNANPGYDYQSFDGGTAPAADPVTGSDPLAPSYDAGNSNTAEWPPGIGNLTAGLTQSVSDFNVGEPFSTFDPTSIPPPAYDMLDPSLTQPSFELGDPTWDQPSFEMGDPSLDQPLPDLGFNADEYSLSAGLDSPDTQAMVSTGLVTGFTFAALHAAPHVAPHVGHAVSGLFHEAVKKGAQRGTEYVVGQKVEQMEDKMEAEKNPKVVTTKLIHQRITSA